jgi:hypothetical protein
MLSTRARRYRDRAVELRDSAHVLTDAVARAAPERLADQYEQMADELDAKQTPDDPQSITIPKI